MKSENTTLYIMFGEEIISYFKVVKDFLDASAHCIDRSLRYTNVFLCSYEICRIYME